MDTTSSAGPDARRRYNTWVATEIVEDFALRYCPPSFRKWSPWLIANTATSSISALALEAIGAALLLGFGFQNAMWALVAALLINTLAGLPIAIAASRYNVDVDLITRGAGFGYVGSTVTSLIYAAFCFITFALQGAVMAGALELALGVPLWLGYIICSAVVIPIVFYGITALNRMQIRLLVPALVLFIAPVLYVLLNHPEALAKLPSVAGAVTGSAGFDPLYFGMACGVLVALVAQIGEQGDYLRFLPPKTAQNRGAWWLATLAAGPGWFLLATIKHLVGMLLASALLVGGMAVASARDPVQMYYVTYQAMFNNPTLALVVVTVYVLIAQVRINVTNAYAGSLAWSNFFSRVTYAHPGRVVWLVFHIGIALLLMEMGVLAALEKVFGLYANVALAWIGAVVADLVINKPLGLSPPGIEFRRAHLYDYNPVGFGSMLAGSTVAIIAFFGTMGPYAQAYSWLIALVLAFTLAPLIAWVTQGKYYLARQPAPAVPGYTACGVCGGMFEAVDSTHCPFHAAPICSLCCTLESACKDVCKPPGEFAPAYRSAVSRLMGLVWRRPVSEMGSKRFASLIALSALLFGALALLFGLTFWMSEIGAASRGPSAQLLLSVFLLLTVPVAVGAWLIVLGREGRDLAEAELHDKNRTLETEIERRTLLERDLAAARDRAEALEQAKSAFLAAMSHEIRTPMNAIIGMAHLAGKAAQNERQRDYVRKIERAAGNLHKILDDVLDFSKIEAGKLELEAIEFDLTDVLDELVNVCGLKADAKGLDLFVKAPHGVPRALVGDPLRLGQILVNFTSNALKFTERGRVVIAVSLAGESVGGVELRFSVTDTGIGLSPAQLGSLFSTFTQADAATTRKYGGTGLGLSICKRLAELMGGSVGAESVQGQGSTFWATARFGRAQHLVPRLQSSQALRGVPALVVDDDADAREIYGDYLASFGMQVQTCDGAAAALALLQEGERPGLILLDYRMDGIDGIALHGQLQALALEPPPRVVMLSGVNEAELRERSQAAGFDAFLSKPIGPSSLFDRIVELFGAVAHSPQESLAELEAEARAQLQGRRILVAEDNEINQQVAREILEDLGVEVTVADNGVQALAEVHAAYTGGLPFHAVLMDMEMPEMDGLSATQELRRDPRNASLPIIAMTANAMDGARRACLAAGMNDHVGKPLDVVLLLNTLMHWLPGARSPAPPPPAITAGLSVLPQIAGLDMALGLKRTGGKPARLLDMLQRFVDRHGELPALAAAAMQAQDSKGATRLIHTLRGLAATLGAVELERLTGALEQALQDGSADWQRHMPALERCQRDLLRNISAGLAALPAQEV